MARYYDFNREDIFPSFFPDRLQDFLAGARTDLRLTTPTATKVAVIPDPAIGAAAISIDGRWRFNAAGVERAHPGGAKGTYVVWAVALDNDIDNSPDPFTDHTDYAFDLRITAGEDPSGAGVEVFEKIGEIDWSGAEITTLRQTYGSVTGAMIAPAAFSDAGDVTWQHDAFGNWSPQLKSNVIGTLELADNSVDTAALIDLAVTTAKIAAGAITTNKLGVSSVTKDVIAALAVEAGKLAAEAVINEKIGTEAVSTGKIQILAVTAAKLAVNAVETAKIANLAVTAAKIAAEAVETAKIANLAVTEGKLADGAASSRKMKPSRGEVQLSADINVNGEWKELPGMKIEVSPAVKSWIKIDAIFRPVIVANPGNPIHGSGICAVGLDGAKDEADTALIDVNLNANGSFSCTIPQNWWLELSAGFHTIRFYAKATGLFATDMGFYHPQTKASWMLVAA